MLVSRLNEEMSFGAQGSAQKIIRHSTGIDLSEDAQYAWTEHTVVEITFDLPIISPSLCIEIMATPYVVPDRLEEQSVLVYISGLFSTFARRTCRGLIAAPIPPSMPPARTTRMSLVIPTARSPASLGISSDQRELGFMLETIAFRVANERAA